MMHCLCSRLSVLQHQEENFYEKVDDITARGYSNDKWTKRVIIDRVWVVNYQHTGLEHAGKIRAMSCV